jgi:hypothetical protein
VFWLFKPDENLVLSLFFFVNLNAFRMQEDVEGFLKKYDGNTESALKKQNELYGFVSTFHSIDTKLYFLTSVDFGCAASTNFWRTV